MMEENSSFANKLSNLLEGTKSALRYIVVPKPYPIEKPIVIQFPVIDICNSKCQMCRIWEQKKSPVIDTDTLRTGLKNSLFDNVVSVGINGGEPTLRNDLADLISVLYEELPSLKTVSLITNAYKYKEVTKRISEVGNVVKTHGGNFDVMVSLDGYREVHDQVRGKPGNFSRAEKVLEYVTNSELVDNVRIGCTIIKENVYGIEDLFEYCKSKNIYIKYRLGIPHKRLYTSDILEPYYLSDADKYHIAEFLEELLKNYEKIEYQRYFYRSLINQIIHDQPRTAGCEWQHRGATITSKGELLYCAVESDVLCNVADENISDTYFSKKKHLEEIVRDKCSDCVHDYTGLLPKKLLAVRLATRYLNLLGLIKPVKKARNLIVSRPYRAKRRFYKRLRKLQALSDKAIRSSDSRLNPEKRIIVIGWYGTETLGDKAILSGVCKGIRSAVSDASITLVSLYPYISRITKSQMPELFDVEIVDISQGISAIPQADLLVFGGGPIMAMDVLAEMEIMCSLAKRLSIPVAVAGCGVGPLGPQWHNNSISKILASASSRIFRDEKSGLNAARLGIKNDEDLVTEDPAFTWLESVRRELESSPKTSGRVLTLGLRDFPYKQYASEFKTEQSLEIKSNYEKAVLSGICTLLEKYPDLIIQPLPMCTNHIGDDDRWFYRRLFRESDIPESNLDTSLLGKELTPIAYCNAISNSDAMLAMRFHSLVFALGLNIPAVVIDYTLGSGKVYNLASRHKVPQSPIQHLEDKFLVREIGNILDSKNKPTTELNHDFCDVFAGQVSGLLKLN